MFARNWLRQTPFARVCVLALTAAMLINAIVVIGPSTRAADDGSITIHIWNCLPGTDANETDPVALANACSIPADGLDVDFADASGSDPFPIGRSTGDPLPGDPAVLEPPFFPSLTISLAEPIPGMASVAFCLEGGVQVPQLVADGVTLKQNYTAPPEGLECDWYLIPAQPTQTPEPTQTPIPTAQPTATPEPTGAPATPSEPTTPTATPAPELTPITLEVPIPIRALPLAPGANISQAFAINDAGVIVGASGLFSVENGLEWQDAVRWVDEGQTIEVLEPLPGAVVNEALNINERGQIVGRAKRSDGSWHAVLWEDDVPQELGTLPNGTSSMAYSINNAGQVVGTSTTGTDQTLGSDGTHAFLWIDGVMTDLGVLDEASRSSALDINDSSIVVGQSGGNAISWTSPDHQIEVHQQGVAAAINAAGSIVMFAPAEDDYLHAYLWRDDHAIDLGTLRGWHSRSLALNEGEVVVGFGCGQLTCPQEEPTTALLWLNGETLELRQLLSDSRQQNWTALQVATGVNASGLIVGYGLFDPTPDDDINNVANTGFLMFSDARYSIIEDEAPPVLPTPIPADEGPIEPPREVAYQGSFYMQDRVVPLSPAEMSEIAAYQGFTLLARTASPPFDAFYIRDSPRSVIRYLPERLDQPNVPCPAEAMPEPLPLTDGSVYYFAGIELDITGASLSPLGGDFSFETGAVRPYLEIFRQAGGQIERFIRQTDQADAPVPQLAPGLSFSGQPLVFREKLLSIADLALVRVGCAGPFKVSAIMGQNTPGEFTRLYIEVGGQWYVYNVTAQSAAVASESASVGIVASGMLLITTAGSLRRARRRSR